MMKRPRAAKIATRTRVRLRMTSAIAGIERGDRRAVNDPAMGSGRGGGRTQEARNRERDLEHGRLRGACSPNARSELLPLVCQLSN